MTIYHYTLTMFRICIYFTIMCYIILITLSSTQSSPINDRENKNKRGQEKGQERIAVVSLLVQNRGMNRGESVYKRMRELFLYSLRMTGEYM